MPFRAVLFQALDIYAEPYTCGLTASYKLLHAVYIDRKYIYIYIYVYMYSYKLLHAVYIDRKYIYIYMYICIYVYTCGITANYKLFVAV